MTDTEITSLAYYVLQVFNEFVGNRKDLSSKWQRNLNAFRRINNGVWKGDEAGEDWRSDAFDAITKQKIMAAVSICIDSYLSGGEIPFDLKPAPVELQSWGAGDEEDLTDEVKENLDAMIEEMRTRIKHQYQLCNAEEAMVNHFLSGSIYGITYAKTCVETYVNRHYVPIPDTLSPTRQHVRYEATTEEEDAPSWKYTTPWDIFTDYEETDLKKCHAVIHRQMLSPFQLMEMLEGRPGVLDGELKKALKAVESKTSADDGDTSELPPALRNVPNRKQTIRYLEYWGRLPKSVIDEFEPAGNSEMWALEAAEDDEKEGNMIECLVGIVGDTVVRLAITGNAAFRPFFCAKWEDNFDGQGGIGIADNTEDVQKIRNGAIRLFFDNKSLSANVMFALKREFLSNKQGGEFKFKPGMAIDIDEECQDARQAIQQFVVQDVGESLISVLQFTNQWADDDSMVPKIQQGGEGRSSETAFELSQRLEKSGKYLARVMRNYDNGLVEPITKWFYDWNMEDPTADGKGAYDVIATGFTSFQNRLEKLTAIRELLQVAAMLPEGQVKLVEIFKEIARMSDVDPDQFLQDEEEAAEQGPDPLQEAELRKVESEIARNEAAAQKSQVDAQVAAEKLKLDQVRAVTGDD